MDNTVCGILKLYEEISDIKELNESCAFFTLFGNRYLILAPDEDKPWEKACIYLFNGDGVDIPHVMLHETVVDDDEVFPRGKYRMVCLYEHESVVFSIIPYKEKIQDAINRLIDLLSMSKLEIEYELQKEFNYFWNNSACKSDEKYIVYINQYDHFSPMNIFYNANKEKKVRFIQESIVLSDINEKKQEQKVWEQHYEYTCFYIPIKDHRGIIPPHRGYTWTIDDIRNIIYGNQIEHICHETYEQLKTRQHTTQSVVLVFSMNVNSRIIFAARINFKNTTRKALFDKLYFDIKEIVPLIVERKDYRYLCEQIGNDYSLTDKRIAVVGAGSLGSYIAYELVKNGARNITIYDDDKLENVNILRWMYNGIGIGDNKAFISSFILNTFHPEICTVPISKKFDVEDIHDLSKKYDMIIFSIGNSDSQLLFNRKLKDSKCIIPVIFAWLEAGGENSHVLLIDYQKTGCYECLYTDDKGNFVNNRASKTTYIIDSDIIHNGCGGTRVAYGTAPLLRTTAAVLSMIKGYWEGKIDKNILIDIDSQMVRKSDTVFPMEACNCCGNKS